MSATVTRRRQAITWTIIAAIYAGSVFCQIESLHATITVVEPSPAMIAGAVAQQQEVQHLRDLQQLHRAPALP